MQGKMLKCVRERKNKFRAHLPVVYLSFLSNFIGLRLKDKFESSVKLLLRIPKWFNAFQLLKLISFFPRVTCVILFLAGNRWKRAQREWSLWAYVSWQNALAEKEIFRLRGQSSQNCPTIYVVTKISGIFGPRYWDGDFLERPFEHIVKKRDDIIAVNNLAIVCQHHLVSQMDRSY